jgi:hypothetical protein
MNRRGFLSLFSAAPAVVVMPVAQSQSAPKPVVPTPMPELLVACNGPTCRGPSYKDHSAIGYVVPQSRCACARNQAAINSLRSATITHT